jgi:hypothetical protein
LSYRIADDFNVAVYERADILAAAYLLEHEQNYTTHVMDHLRAHGNVAAKWYAMSEAALPNTSKEPLTKKKMSLKALWGMKWIEALKDMKKNNFEWDKHFSEHDLRALLIEQCHATEDKRKMSLQDYVHVHNTPGEPYKVMADENYSSDLKTIKTYVAKRLRSPTNGAAALHGATRHEGHHDQTVVPTTHHDGHHGKAVGSTPVPEHIAGSRKAKELLTVDPNLMSGLAHHELDDMPDDYRV